MNIDFRNVLLFIHILFGITWFGAILFVGWAIFPVTSKLTFTKQREFLLLLMKRIHLFLTLFGLSVITTGILLGTVFGPMHSWEAIISTQYGRLFLSAFIIATFSLLWGTLVSYPSTMNLLKRKQIWEYAELGGRAPLQRMLRQITFISSIEVTGLTIVLWIMVQI